MLKPRGPRANPYKIRPSDDRGKTGKEPVLIKSFWKDFSMDEAMTWTPEELNANLEKFFDNYEARRLADDRNWQYPSIKY